LKFLRFYLTEFSKATTNVIPPSIFVEQIFDISKVYGLDDRGSRVRFPAAAGKFSLHYRVQTDSGTRPASYPMGTGYTFPGGKAAGAWSWSLSFI